MPPARALVTCVVLAGLSSTGCARKDPPPPEKLATASAHGSTAAPPVSASSLPAPRASSGPSPAERASAALKRPFNVILVLVDSLRADMPWNGYPRDIAPSLTAFAKSAVSFPHAYSLSAYTAKSVGGLLGAHYPSEMPRTGRFFTVWPDESNLFLSEVLRGAGHRTLGGHAHGYFHKQLGIHQGFDDWRILPNVILGVQAGITGDRLGPLAIEMLSKPENVDIGEHCFFAYFHFMDPHHTYERHPGLPAFGAGSLRDQYDHEVLFVDHWLGKLLDFVDAQPWADRTAVILSADHGEAFGEHGAVRHGYEVWEPIVHVPLLVRVPGVTPRTVSTFRSHLDMAKTILDLMGVAPPESFRGRSLVPDLLGATPEERNVIVDLPRDDLQDRRRALITPDGYKLIAFGDEARLMLFNVLRDPAEEHELSESEPETFERMKRIYREESERIPVVEAMGKEPLKGAPAGRRW